MFETISTAWRIKELRERILFTLAMFVVFRAGSAIPVPGVEAARLAKYFQEDTIFGFLNVIGGESLSRFTIFALGIMPYINASIIMQLLTIVIPKLKEWSQDSDGRKKISQLTRYGTVLIAVTQGIGYSFIISGAVPDKSFLSYFIIVLTLTAGTVFLMWLGELITEKGIGNGISLLIFAGIVAGFPGQVIRIVEQVRFGQVDVYKRQEEHRALHGLTRTLIQNMITGVTEGFTRSLELVGVGSVSYTHLDVYKRQKLAKIIYYWCCTNRAYSC